MNYNTLMEMKSSYQWLILENNEWVAILML